MPLNCDSVEMHDPKAAQNNWIPKNEMAAANQRRLRWPFPHSQSDSVIVIVVVAVAHNFLSVIFLLRLPKRECKQTPNFQKIKPLNKINTKIWREYQASAFFSSSFRLVSKRYHKTQINKYGKFSQQIQRVSKKKNERATERANNFEKNGKKEINI